MTISQKDKQKKGKEREGERCEKITDIFLLVSAPHARPWSLPFSLKITTIEVRFANLLRCIYIDI